MLVDVNDFEKQIDDVYFKNEKYSIRNNGAVLRHSKIKSNPKLLDNIWIFGRVNSKNGYMYLSDLGIHRLICFTFHGEPPTSQQVVDHIDTNRQNN